MHLQSLKNKTINGLLWSSIDKFAVLVIGLIIGLILARLLMPSDYGLMGMLTVIMALSHLLVESGFSSALIQKHTPTEVDYSTIFFFNLIVAFFFYIILFFSAPYIADFFKSPQLIKLIRVLSFSIIINALSIVQQTKLTIRLDFKMQTIVSFISVGISGILGIYAAYNGFGVWALVIQNISASLFKTLLLIYFNKWMPRFVFDISSFKQLFKFSSNLLVAGLAANLGYYIYTILIGRFFTTKDLGYYTNARLYPEYLGSPIGNILVSVTYPVLVSLKNDQQTMVQVYARLLRVTVFFALPFLTLFAILSEPFIRLILTEKWLPIATLMQWMCFANFLLPLCSLNMLTLNVIGKSKLFLRIELFKLPITIITLLVTITIGLKAVVIGYVVVMLFSYFLTTYFTGKLFGYGLFYQIKDVRSVILATIFMALAVFFLNHYINSDFLKLLIGGLVGVSTFLLASFVMKIEELNDRKELSNSILLKKRG